MLMLAEPLGRALEAAGASRKTPAEAAENAGPADLVVNNRPRIPRVIYLSPSGRPFTQALARELAAGEELILLCGRYEGIDQRIIDLYVDDEISVGDYVLSSGEAAALVVIDATYRLVESVITAESLEEESFSGGLLEYPQYTRPEVYATFEVPGILLSGHHENIRRWRLEKRVQKTLAFRPDLIRRGKETGLFNAETIKVIEELEKYERDTGD
jgi:tRNA (guanine37-N1)-methyltransferase